MMSGKLRRRLDIIERHLAESARRDQLANCNCPEILVALPHQVEELEAEMNRSCQVHGLRRPKKLLVVSFVNPDTSVTEESVKLGELVAKYSPPLSDLH
jgi:hypothetical protein